MADLSRWSRAFWPALVAITIVAVYLRFDALDYGLPHWGTRPDELPIVEHTRHPAEGDLNVGWAVYPPAYVYMCYLWGEAVLGVGHVAGIFTSSDYLGTLRENRALIFLVLRSLSAIVGAATVLAIALMGRRLFGDVAGLGVALLLATCFLHVRDSHTFKPDVMLSLGVVACFAAMIPLADRATVGRGALAGAAVGAATAAKYPGLLLLVPVYAAAVMGSSLRGARRLLTPAGIMAGLVAAFVFLATSPLLIFDEESLGFLYRVLRALFPQPLVSSLLPMPENAPGTALQPPEPGLDTLAYHATVSLWHGMGALATILAPVALAWGLLSRRRLPALGSVFLLVWFVVIGLSPHKYARYVTPVVPVLLLLEVGLLGALVVRLPVRARALAFAVSIGIVALQPLSSTLAFNRLASRTDTRLLATSWMAEHLPKGSRVAIVGTVLWPWGVPEMPAGVTAVGTQREGRAEPAFLAEAGVDYVLTHDHAVFSSTLRPEITSKLEPRLRPLVAFETRSSTHDDAIYEPADAFYIPIARFGVVERPGPTIRIYAFE